MIWGFADLQIDAAELVAAIEVRRKSRGVTAGIA
jgi:hypothetical protein